MANRIEQTWPASNVELWPIDKIVPFKNNPRIHTDSQIELIASSMREDGVTAPILVDDDGVIIYGHGRRLAAIKNGFKKYPVAIARGFSEQKKRSLRIKDNSLSALSSWDAQLLSLELQDLKLEGVDLQLLGFPEGELGSLLAGPGTEGLTDPDDVPEPPKTPVVRQGDLWVLGKHRLLCGDSNTSENISKITGGKKPDLCLSDPPYGINIVSGFTGTVGAGKAVTIDAKRVGTMSANGASPFGGVKNKRGTVGAANWVDANEYLPIHGDDKPFDPSHLVGIAKNHILFGGNYFASKLKDGRCWLVWDKNNTGNFADAELAWTDLDKGVKLYRFTWNGLVREGNRKDELTKRIHPTQKPVGLFAQILEDFSVKNQAIIDPYLGSGTSLIACEKIGRVCYGIEIEPHYVQQSLERWQNFTGKQATLDGKTLEQVTKERRSATKPKRKPSSLGPARAGNGISEGGLAGAAEDV